MVDCNYCDKSFLNERGMKTHAGQVHKDEFLTEKKCKNCGEIFKVSPYYKDKKLCSEECKSGYFSKKYEGKFAGKDNPSWKGGQVKKKCENCGGFFKCEKVNYERRKTCSHKCKGERQSEIRVGKDAPNWKEDSKTYKVMGSNWGKIREEIIKEGEEKCSECNMTREEHYENYDCDLHVDHIIPRRFFIEHDFKSINDANKKSNLIPLCVSCHSKFDAQKRNSKYEFEVTNEENKLRC